MRVPPIISYGDETLLAIDFDHPGAHALNFVPHGGVEGVAQVSDLVFDGPARALKNPRLSAQQLPENWRVFFRKEAYNKNALILKA